MRSAGPNVRTERLFRSAAFPDKTVGESALPEVEPSADQPERTVEAPNTPPAAVAPRTPSATIEPMTATTQAPQQPLTYVQPPNPGVSTLGVIGIIGGITTAVGFFDMLLNHQFTLITGVAFILACAIAALVVRPSDLWTAVITAPIAYLGALILAGQPSTLGGAGDLVLREASLIFTGLAFNAPYIFGGTAVALVIVLIRRAKLRTAR